jgi:hypothetical protein
MVAGMWACEELGTYGLHHRRLSCQSHLGTDAESLAWIYILFLIQFKASVNQCLHLTDGFGAGNISSCNTQLNKNLCEWLLGWNSS